MVSRNNIVALRQGGASSRGENVRRQSQENDKLGRCGCTSKATSRRKTAVTLRERCTQRVQEKLLAWKLGQTNNTRGVRIVAAERARTGLALPFFFYGKCENAEKQGQSGCET